MELKVFLALLFVFSCCRVGAHHVKVKPKLAVLTMLKRLDKIRFRGSKRDEFLDLAESPTASDNEGIEDILMKPRLSLRDPEELREPVSQMYQTQLQVAFEPS